MGTLISDLKHAARTLLRSPGFAGLAVAILALGTGANTAIFSLVDAVLLSPILLPEPERVVLVTETVRREEVERRTVSYPDFLDWRDHVRAFERIAAFSNTSFTLTGSEAAERVEGELVSASYFPILGAEAARGRTFRPDEDAAPGAHPVAVLGHDLWQRRFAGDPEMVGRTIELNGRDMTVIGILPEGFRGLDDDTDVWVPMAMVEITGAPDLFTARGARWHSVIARLAPGATIEQAQAELDALSRRLEIGYADTNTDYGALVLPFEEEVLGDLRPRLLTLLGAVGFVLLIACANVANLMLARAAARQRETAIRAALGAGRGRLVRHALAESLLLALLGGALGVLVALWAIDLLLATSPVALPSFVKIGVDLPVLAFSLALALATGLLMGVVPALQTSSPDLNDTLKEGGRSGGGGVERRRVRAVLVITEVALALLLLAGAGLMIQSFRRMQAVDPGFEAASVVALRISLPEARYAEDGQAWAFGERLLERLRALPAVTDAALTSDIPLEGSSSANLVSIEGRPLAPSERGIRVYRHMVSPGFFRTAGISLLAGRSVLPADRVDAPPVVVVSEAFARRVFPGESPLGKRIKLGRPDSDRPWIEVVGIAADVKHRVLVADPLENPDDPDLYFPLAQREELDLGVLVRSSTDPTALAGALRSELAALDRDVPVYAVTTLAELLTDQTSGPRFAALLMGVFGTLALLLAALGIYGVLSYSVAQRFHEIGIRMALGAARRDVVRLVLAQALGLTLAGVALGLAGAAALTRLLESQLYETSPTDPATLTAVAGLLLAVALVATWLPARRAMRLDPVTTLRAG